MKLKKLILHNIASIQDAEIDFANGSLAESDVFLITGKTGAGKSTILDAICLALYDNTPRFKNNLSEGNNEADGDLRIDNPRQILRRNTGEGYVTLTFTGNNECDYEARWEVRRSHNKPTGSLQPRKWSLKRVGENVELTRVGDIQAEMSQAVGLDFTQFCRTCMLAQGEFSKFLNSKDNDKATILERITGTDIYSRIGRRIHEICADRNTRWKEALSLIEGIRLLSDEERIMINERLAELQKEDKEKEKEQKKLQTKREWLSTKSNLEKTLSDAITRLQLIRAKTENDDYLLKQKLERDWTLTADPRRWLQEVKDQEQTISSLTTNINALRKEFDQFEGGIAYERSQLDKISNELARLTEYFANIEPRNVTIENSSAIILHLKYIMDRRKIIAEKRDLIEKESEDFNVLQAKVTTDTANIDKKNRDIDQMEKEISSLEAELESYNLDKLRSEKDGLTAHLTELQLVMQEVESFMEKSAALARLQSEVTELKKSLDAKRLDVDRMKAQVDRAVIEEAKCKAVYEAGKDTVDTFAKTMRQRLHLGDDCPVCRQKIQHVFESEDELDALIASHQTSWQEAKTNLESIKDAYNLAQSDYNARTELVATEEKRIALEQANIDSKHSMLVKRLNVYNIGELSDNVLSELSELSVRGRNEMDVLTESIKNGESKEKILKQKQTLLVSERTQQDTRKDDLRKLKEEIARRKTLIEGTHQTILDLSAENEKDATEVDSFVQSAWNIDWRANIESFIEELNEAVTLYHKNMTLRDQLQKELSYHDEIYKRALSDRKIIIDYMADWNLSNTQIIPVSVNEIDRFGNNLISNLKFTLKGLEEAAVRKKEKEEALSEFLTQNVDFNRSRLEELIGISSETITSIADEIRNIREELVRANESLNEARQRLNEHALKCPTFDENETPEFIDNRLELLGNERKTISEHIGALNRDLSEDERNKAEVHELKKDADSKKEDYDKWVVLDRYVGSADGSLFRKIAQSYVLESLIHSANHYMNTLSGRYRLRNTPGSFAILVDDAYQGGTTRAASTLSGGETFLVSLSLALALSDIGVRLGLDTLFIDEGFGTLSGEPLQNAIETLRALHKRTGRHVGIISHIEELRERIPVQIRVEQEGNSSYSTIIVTSPSTSLRVD
ncbi:MAG: AAA family ATPase [Muribaculaceae bacterium]|nr:AAA family ATPase [Muribaculaceae bacterium]